jgi:glycosyltransferase involved in cell wall biosynthesis
MKPGVKLLAVINSPILKQGSFEDYLVAYAAEGKRLGWKLGFVFPAVGKEGFEEALNQHGAEVFVTGLWGTDEGKEALKQQIGAFQPDLVNFHFCDSRKFIGAFLYCRRKGLRVIDHYHGEIRPLSTVGWRSRQISELRLLSWLFYMIVTVSEANATFLRALHVAGPVKVVYNGIDVAAFVAQSGERRTATDPNAPLTCLYVGSLIRRKRVDILLRAFAEVKAKSPRARLVIVGGGPLETELKALATELGVNDAVQFTGLLKEFPLELFRSADLFVSASESESFGLVFGEAMAFRLPVVACRVGGIPEVVEDGVTGRLVPANDPAAMSKALLELLQDNQVRLRMGEAAAKRVTDKFQLADTVSRTFEVFAGAVRG